jgi:hypothetical protein
VEIHIKKFPGNQHKEITVINTLAINVMNYILVMNLEDKIMDIIKLTEEKQ